MWGKGFQNDEVKMCYNFLMLDSFLGAINTYKFCAVDESGTLGLSMNTSRYFLVSLFLFNDLDLERKVRKFIGKINHKKNRQKINLLHAKRDDNNLKIKLFKFLKEVDWQAVVCVCDKRKINGKNFEKNLDYQALLGFALGQLDLEKIYVSSPVNKKEFHGDIQKIHPGIEVTTPSANCTIQLSDFIAWSAFKNLEDGDSLYFNLLREKIKIINFEAKQNP